MLSVDVCRNCFVSLTDNGAEFNGIPPTILNVQCDLEASSKNSNVKSSTSNRLIVLITVGKTVVRIPKADDGSSDFSTS